MSVLWLTLEILGVLFVAFLSVLGVILLVLVFVSTAETFKKSIDTETQQARLNLQQVEREIEGRQRVLDGMNSRERDDADIFGR